LDTVVGLKVSKKLLAIGINLFTFARMFSLIKHKGYGIQNEQLLLDHF